MKSQRPRAGSQSQQLTFTKLLANPEKFTFDHAFRIAALIEVDDKKIIDLIYEDARRGKKGKKPR